MAYQPAVILARLPMLLAALAHDLEDPAGAHSGDLFDALGHHWIKAPVDRHYGSIETGFSADSTQRL